MRTTILLPDALYAEVKVTAARERRTVTSMIEEALREALARRADDGERAPFRLPVLAGDGLRPGVDLHDKEALADLLDDR